jgi:hypothetical protein
MWKPISQLRSVRLALTAREACAASSACACPMAVTRRSNDSGRVAGVVTLGIIDDDDDIVFETQTRWKDPHRLAADGYAVSAQPQP